MLPLEQAPDLEQVARRLERAARSLERRTS
jgi:hypothetical protein